jgi:hypothetical protein
MKMKSNKCIDSENGRRARALRSKSRAVWPFPVMTRRYDEIIKIKYKSDKNTEEKI